MNLLFRNLAKSILVPFQLMAIVAEEVLCLDYEGFVVSSPSKLGLTLGAVSPGETRVKQRSSKNAPHP